MDGAITRRVNRGKEEEEKERDDSDVEEDTNDTDGDVNDLSDALEDTFNVGLPKLWHAMLKLLDVPSLASTARHMCPDGHHVWRFLPEGMYEMHKEDKCEVCNKARFHTLKCK